MSPESSFSKETKIISQMEMSRQDFKNTRTPGKKVNIHSVIQCKTCDEVLLVKYYQTHECYQGWFREKLGQINDQKNENRDSGSDGPKVRKRKTKRLKWSRKSTNTADSGLLTSPTALSNLLNLQPVVRKIWRAPFFHYRAAVKSKKLGKDYHPQHFQE